MEEGAENKTSYFRSSEIILYPYNLKKNFKII